MADQPGQSQKSSADDRFKKKKLVNFELDDDDDAGSVHVVEENVFGGGVPGFQIQELFKSGGGELTMGRPQSSPEPGGFNHCGGLEDATACSQSQPSPVDEKHLFDKLGVDLVELQNRILELEKHLEADNCGLPPIITDLKTRVDQFKNKLESAEQLSRMKLDYEQLDQLDPLNPCQRFPYRRTSDEKSKRTRDQFLNICDADVTQSTRDWLRSATFDSSPWRDEQILWFLQHMFLDLGLPARYDIPLPVLRNFLYEVYKNYNQVPFHNFRHCFCVAQMMYVIAWSVDVPNRMGHLETLILLTSCICHDLDHPGYNNIYQINARTELALRYNDISPLENHHCSVAFRILENPDCNIFATLDKETFKEVREGIIRCILATDMARHNEILSQFKEATPEFDFGNKAHKNLLSMILIKVADISNEARPMSVAEPWLDRLLMEFFKQSDQEKKEGLPVTPFMDRDKITKPSSQCSFIGFVLLPLFEALGELLPELHPVIIAPAREALDHYKRLNDAAKDERMRRKSVVEIVTSWTESEGENDNESVSMVKSASGHSVRSRRSAGASSSQSRQRSKSSEDCELDGTPPSSPGGLSGLLEDFEELDERDEEEETATEVEVSEKALKFKISTEGSVTSCQGRKSCPGSRKGSRERNQYLEGDQEWSKLMREEAERRSLKRSVTSDTMDSRKGSSDSSGKTSRKGSGGSDRTEDARRSSKPDEYRRKSSYQSERKPPKYEYRRKSLAVVERMRDRDISKRRRSVSSSQEAKKKELKKEEVKKRESEERSRKFDTLIVEKEENRYSREFETSCWGLQNLKKDTVVLNEPPVLLNTKTLTKTPAEKSKSEDNLTIKGQTEPVANNVLRTDDSLGRLHAERGKKGTNTVHLSFLAKLKSFKFSFAKEDDDAEEKTVKSDNQSGDERSRTLPKTKKPNRTTGKVRRGWRALIGRTDGPASSSLEVLPPGSPSPANKARRKTSVEGMCTKSLSLDKKRGWLSSPKKSGLLAKGSVECDENGSRNNFLSSLTSSFRKKGSRADEDSVAGSSSAQEGSKPN